MDINATLVRIERDNVQRIRNAGYEGWIELHDHLKSRDNAKRRMAGLLRCARLIILHPDKQYARKCHRNYLIQAAGFREQAMRAGK